MTVGWHAFSQRHDSTGATTLSAARLHIVGDHIKSVTFILWKVLIKVCIKPQAMIHENTVYEQTPNDFSLPITEKSLCMA